MGRWALILITIFSAWPLWAASPSPRLAFAQELQANKEFYRAVQEYQALLVAQPDLAEARLGLAVSYRLGGEVDQAVAFLNQLPQRKPQEELLLGLSYLDLNPGGLFKENQQHRQAALQHLKKQDEKRVQAFVAEAEEFRAEAPHSPWVAGSMSAIFPGLGSAYNGRWREASYAAFFTLGFAFSAQEQVKNDRPDLGLVFGAFALVFYGGSIYAAANGADKANDEYNRAQFNQLRGKYGIWFDAKHLLVETTF